MQPNMMTNKQHMELLNLRKRVQDQRAEIKRLQDRIRALTREETQS